MKFLLLYPEDNVLKEFMMERPPLGIAYIAANLRKNKHHVKIIDLNLEKEPDKILKNEINKFDIIGISIISSFYISAQNLIKKIRAINKKIPIIIGGPHVTSLPKKTLMENDVNYAVIGEGEITTVNLCNSLEKKKPLNKINGIFYKKKEKIYMNKPQKYNENLDSLPFPARDLLKLKGYLNYIDGKRSTTMMTSRGCPYNCIYCCKTEGHKWRARSAKNVVDEIEEVVKKYSIRCFYFHDDLFTFSKQRILDICKGIIRRGLKIKFKCESRVDHIDFEMLRALKKAGCYEIHYGVETGDEFIMKKIRKYIKKEQAIKTFHLTRKAGIYTKAYFMLGFPWETKQSVEKTIDLAKKVAADETQFTIVMPYPDTELWGMAIKEGSIDPENVGWDTTFKAIALDFKNKVFFTKYISEKELIKLRKKAYKTMIYHTLLRKIKRGEFIHIYKIIKEKWNLGFPKFIKSLFFG